MNFWTIGHPNGVISQKQVCDYQRPILHRVDGSYKQSFLKLEANLSSQKCSNAAIALLC